ncbi:hypothetical protein ABFS82_06G160800 [Erythranthe guttata]
MSLVVAKNCISFIILSCIFFLQATAIEEQNCFLTTKYEVRITNYLPIWSNIPMKVHCASGDDDLGYHKLYVSNGFKWNFCDNIWGTTLYFCHFWWNSRLGPKEKKFDAFTEKMSSRCTNGVCNWEARQNGIYFSGSGNPTSWQKMYDWDNVTTV